MKSQNFNSAYDWDTVSAEYLRDAKRNSAEQIWLRACPPVLRDTNWAHPQIMPYTGAINEVLGYQYGRSGLLLSGPTGCGKSRAMWKLMHRLAVAEGRDGLFFSSAAFFDDLQSRINYGRDEARGWVESVANRQILFLDDLGQEAVTKAKEDWAKSWLFHLLDLRLGRGLPLFVTTNLNAAELSEYGGEARGDPFVRRLLELCDPVVFKRPHPPSRP